jgi:hypothetical protein
MDRRTNGHDEVNSRFPQFWERAYKRLPYNYLSEFVPLSRVISLIWATHCLGGERFYHSTWILWAENNFYN